MFGSGRHVLRRRAAVEGVLGQQEFTHLLNISQDVDQFNTSYVKDLFASAVFSLFDRCPSLSPHELDRD